MLATNLNICLFRQIKMPCRSSLGKNYWRKDTRTTIDIHYWYCFFLVYSSCEVSYQYLLYEFCLNIFGGRNLTLHPKLAFGLLHSTCSHKHAVFLLQSLLHKKENRYKPDVTTLSPLTTMILSISYSLEEIHIYHFCVPA